MEAIREGLITWNKEVFQNIYQRKNHCKARLMGIQRALAEKYSSSLLKLEGKLIREFTDILNQEDAYWRQKAKRSLASK